MKKISPILTALLITVVIGFGVMVVGVSAFTNKNTVPLQNTPGDSAASSTVSNPAPSADVQQLNQQISDLQSQLNQADQAIQQYQSLLLALQQRGVIQIGNDGNIYLPQTNSSH